MSKSLIKVTPEMLMNMTGRLQQNMDQLMRLADEQNVLLQQLNEVIEDEIMAHYCKKARISMQDYLRENSYAVDEISRFVHHILTQFPPSPPPPPLMAKDLLR